MIYESTIREVKEETGLMLCDLEQVGLIHMYNPENHGFIGSREQVQRTDFGHE
ncbi:hypothetical protein D3C77_411390 [compost metagenome]